MFIQEIIKQALELGYMIELSSPNGGVPMCLLGTNMEGVYDLDGSLFTESETEGAKMLVRVHAEKCQGKS